MTAGGNKFSKVQSGQRRILPADVWNAMLDTIEYVDGLRESGGALTGPMSRSPTIIQIANQSGRDISAYTVLALDTPTNTPAADMVEWCNRWAMTGVVPQLPGYFGKFCVPIEGIRAGEVGPAVVAGLVPVVVDQPGNIALPFADVGHNRTDALVTGTAGLAQILWQESGKGIHWAIVRLGAVQLGLRAFEITQDCWPSDSYAWGQFLDDSTNTQYYLYPPVATSDSSVNLYLGVGRTGGYGVPGTRGWAQWSFMRQRWEIVWGNFKFTALAKTDYAIAKDSTGSMTVWWANLNTGALESSSKTVTVRNAGDQPIPKDQIVEIWYDRQERQWFGLVAASGGTQWARVQTGFANASGAAPRTVYVKACNWNDTDGSTETGDRFNVSTPLKANADTSLFAGYVVGYQTVGDGTKVIMTDCWDAPIGTVRAWDSTEAIRDGWEELSGAKGRFLVGCNYGETWDTPGHTGGVDLHKLTDGLQDHPEIAPNLNCLGLGMYGWRIHTMLNGSMGPLDHRVKNETTSSIAPPWYAVKWIKRTS